MLSSQNQRIELTLVEKTTKGDNVLGADANGIGGNKERRSKNGKALLCCFSSLS